MLGVAANFFVVVLFGSFVAAQPDVLLDGLVRLVVPAHRARVRATLVAAGNAMRKWLLAKVLRIAFIGIATYVALKLLGVPLALLLAAIAALLNFVPMLLGVLIGPVGLAVATPLVAGMVVVVQRLYVEDVLEESTGQ